jgi:hypothetical protein
MLQLMFALIPETTTDSLDLKELTQASTSIIIGEVLTTRVQVDNGVVSTYATIIVDETLKGNHQQVVDVRVPGGKFEDVEMIVPNVPQFFVDTKVLLYLNNQSIVGIDDGAFFVENDRAWRNANNKNYHIPHSLFPSLDVLEASYYFDSWPLEDIRWIASHTK